MAAAARKARASACNFMAGSSSLVRDVGSVEGGGEPFLFAIVSGTVPEPRPSDSGRAVPADDLAVGVLAEQVVDEEVLGNDGIALHAHHLGDVRDAARAVAKAGGLDDD